MDQNRCVGVIVPAAGCGSRMGTRQKKQYLTLKNLEILERTLIGLLREPLLESVWITVPEEDLEALAVKIAKWKVKHDWIQHIEVIAGGATRQSSVYNALIKMNGKCDIVIVHDGVRPFVPQNWIKTHVSKLSCVNGLSAGFASVDTVKRVDDEQCVVETLNRDQLWNVQTPQMFNYKTLLHAHQCAIEERFVGTDDMSLLERIGEKVLLVPCERYNIKITTPYDLVIGEAIAMWLEENVDKENCNESR